MREKAPKVTLKDKKELPGLGRRYVGVSTFQTVGTVGKGPGPLKINVLLRTGSTSSAWNMGWGVEMGKRKQQPNNARSVLNSDVLTQTCRRWKIILTL